MKMNSWFEVDKQGFPKILERKGKEFGPFELVQNAWDERGVTKVTMSLEYKGRNRALLIVERLFLRGCIHTPSPFLAQRTPPWPDANSAATASLQSVSNLETFSSFLRGPLRSD